MGNELIPRCFKELKHRLPDPEDEEDEKETFYKVIKNARKVTIENISGSEEHLNNIREIAKNVGQSCRYLYLSFDGSTDDPELARQYVDVFKQFSQVDTIRLEVISDGNFTNIAKAMISDGNFIWFDKVTVLKCYKVYEAKDVKTVGDFLTSFKGLEHFRGITEEQFDPLSFFHEKNKPIPKLSWTLSENQQNREKVLSFLNWNQNDKGMNYLRLHGGTIDKIDVDNIHQKNLRHLKLQDMPSVNLKAVFKNLPVGLQTLRIDNVDDFSKEDFGVVA